MLGFRFSYLYKLHTDAFIGFNAVCLPGGNPPGAMFRSSLPATPVSTPIRENGRFSEQALRERLCRTPSPRKCRLFESRVSEPDLGLNSLDSGWQLSSPEDEIFVDKPLPFKTKRPEIKPIPSSKEEDPQVSYLKRRIFVGNISYRVTRQEMKDFFSKFGKVVDCIIVQDHIKRRSRGYGFVVFSKVEEAEQAMNATTDALDLDGRVLRVFQAEAKRSAKLKREAQQILLQQNKDNEREVSAFDGSTLQFTTAKKNKPQNINELNDDILLLIFSYLDIKHRIRIERVCKRWQSLVVKSCQIQDSLEFPHVFSIFGGLPLTNSILHSILKKCSSNLKTLNLSTASHILDYQAVEIIATFCINLENCNLSGVKVTNVSLQQLAMKCPKLKSVILQRCLEVGEKGIWWLLHLCKKLEHIDLTGNARVTGQCFHMAGSSLTTATLNDCSKFSSAGFTKVATRCRQLTALYLNDCHELTDRALELLCQSLRNLKTFSVGGVFKELTPAGLHHIGRLSSLEHLCLAHNQNVDDDVIYAISRGCRKIRFVDISGCYSGVGDSSLSSLSSCVHLRTLHISYLNKITNDGISAVARQGQLEVVQLRGCPNIGDQGLVTMVLMCSYLQSLDFSGCIHVTNMTVQACLDNVTARVCPSKLVIVIGGTSVDLDALDIDSPLLEVSRLDLCANHLRPDRYFYAGDSDYYPDDLEVDDDTCEDDGDEQGAAGGGGASWHISEEMMDDFLTSDDPVMFDNEWDEEFQAPF